MSLTVKKIYKKINDKLILYYRFLRREIKKITWGHILRILESIYLNR